MTYASLELCTKLNELTGWEAPECWAAYKSYDGTEETMVVDSNAGELGHDMWRKAYAYDLGYLLRKLPDGEIRNREGLFSAWQNNSMDIAPQYAESPEDAAAKLLIELLKAKVEA